MKEKYVLKDTNLFMGKLFVNINGILKEEDIYIPNIKTLKIEEDNLLYNSKPRYGDCHFLPINKDVVKKCADEIKDLKKRILDCKESKELNLKNVETIKILEKYGYNNKDHNIFPYIKYQKDNWIYEIVFVRFYKDNKRREVNCILNSLQFCAYSEGVRSIDYYPDSCNDGVIFQGEKACYYNPNSTFESSPQNIICEFVNFVKMVENIKTL